MTATALPPGRYGPAPDPRRRRRTVAALVALGVLGVAVVVWLGLGAAQTPVHWSPVGFRIDGAESVEVTYDVTRLDPSMTVECRVEALNTSHAQVGVVVVEVPPSSDGTVRRTTTVRTSEPAVTGVVDSCWVPEDDGSGGPSGGD